MNEYTIISDIHLGSNVCRADKVCSFLDQLQTQTLILNGDIFDNLDFRRLKKSHWRIIKKLRSIAKTTKVIWISGNHDCDAEVIAHLIGADFVMDYLIQSDQTHYIKKILVIHGDTFDDLIFERPILSKVADKFYRVIQFFDKRLDNNYYYSGVLKRNSKSFTRSIENTAKKAMNYAKSKGYHSVILGHLHQSSHLTMFDSEIEYVNGGCWTDSVCNFVTINQGKIELKEYNDT